MSAKIESKTVVCILGMHRSGTSCLTGCLQEHGLYLGDVVTEAKYNRKGNRENNVLRELNDDLLAFNGGAWDKPPSALNWNDAFRRRRDALIAQYAPYKHWGFKDPRTLLTLPFWLEADLNLTFVGTFRHPLAVAQSLLRRPGLAPQTNPVDLWRYYNLNLLKYLAECPFPLVCFDWPAPTYAKAVGTIARRLMPNETPNQSQSFFDENLRHEHLESEKTETIGKQEIKIYEDLMRYAIKDP